MWQKLFSNRAAREKWDSSLIWFRLRYLKPEAPQRCLNLLSRPQACGRVALYFQPDDRVSRLYLGIPESHLRLLHQMMTDFGFLLKPKSAETSLPLPQRMMAVKALPWGKPFMAHIVNESVFVSLIEENNKGSYFPQEPATTAQPAASWQLPERPLAGLTMQPSWNEQPPTCAVPTGTGPRRWLLGRSQAGLSIYVRGRVNVYGRQEAVSDWLVHQVTQMISLNPANLVVIDGVGDLVPQLKRKAAVTRLLGEQLVYVDIDSASLAGGFNPLAAVLGEAVEDQVQRWQQWFQGMAVHPQGIQLLAQAHQDGIADIPALRKWLKQKERQGHYMAVSSLRLALNRLTASRKLREWLDWPTNLYEILPEGSLFFTCKASGWDRQQLLRSALWSAMQVKDVHLIVHGFPWQKVDESRLGKQVEVVISNGPLLPDNTVVLTESHAQGVSALVKRFLASDACWGENLELLQRGEGLVIMDDNVLFTTWNGRVPSSNELPLLTPGNSS